MLEVAAKPLRTAAFVGESLIVDVVVHNRGDSAVEIGDVGGPIRFELRGPDGRTRTFGPRFRRLSPIETPVAAPIFKTTIAPGRSYSTSADVAGHAGEELVPGRYDCTVRIAGGSAPPFSFTLEAPRVSSLSQHGGGAGWLTDGTMLFVRQGSRDPDQSVAVRALAGVAGLSSVAVDYFCFAALLDGKLGIGVAGPRQLLGWELGGETGIEDARLLPCGIVARDTTAFVIAGARGARVATVELTQDTPLAGSKPRNITFGPLLDVALPPTTQVLCKSGELTAIWSDGSRVMARSLAPESATCTLIDRSPVLAINCSQKTVDVLLENAQVHVDMTGTVVYERALPAPPPNVTAWAIGSEAGAAVVALAGKTIVQARQDRWTDVATLDADTPHLAVVSSHWPRYWAQWIDPASGLRHAPIEPT